MKTVVLILGLVAISGCTQKVNVGPGGPQGVPGNNGVSIVTTVLTAIPNQCPTGGQVILVAQDNLNTGVWDASDKQMSAAIVCNGLQGTAGTNATPVHIVQFCPNDTPTYPSVFVEVGLEINGTIYAVYSIPGAFLTPLTPGIYTSSAIGSSCDFTVNDDGTVSE